MRSRSVREVRSHFALEPLQELRVKSDRVGACRREAQIAAQSDSLQETDLVRSHWSANVVRSLLNYKINRFASFNLNFILEPPVYDFGGLDNLREAMVPLYVRDTDRILAIENRALIVAQPAAKEDTSVYTPPITTFWGEKSATLG